MNHLHALVSLYHSPASRSASFAEIYYPDLSLDTKRAYNKIIHRRIRVILILPPGRRRISEILRRSSLWEELLRMTLINNLRA